MLAFIGLGANLAEPVAQLDAAVAALKALAHSRLAAVSPYYRNPPMGPQDQPDYVNAVAALETGLEPEVLLDALQAIENAQGRVRQRRWGARSLDLDLLLYGSAQIATLRLSVPHPGMLNRAFVLLPLADVAPDLVFPDGTSLSEALGRVDLNSMQRIATQ
ncbi:MAG: 2-amino-4-hydroxy-6-hydroxymethyldihydropteridine diphosphokinase [Gammaproteobacteria bacterium]|nr:2-amino-4-hydroxy-6-hydroxymethyldihydropteridine diphosphokinase [Gammaproteobacteria bacterium]